MSASIAGLGLRSKLALGLGLVALLTAGLLLSWVGPGTSSRFADASDRLIGRSADTMRSMARAHTEQSAELLVDLIQYTTDARRRLLADLPLSLYAGGRDLEPLREALQSHDTSRSRQLRSNVNTLAHEMGRRAFARIEAETGRIVAEQREHAERLAGELRWASVLLTGLVFALSIGLLGLATFRVVVRPVRDLRRAAVRVAAGDLAVDVRAGSGDEVGGLAADFAAMVERLRASRAEIDRKNAELQRWNQTLEAEVARKTEHLERALADLRRTQRRLVHAAKMASVGTLAGGVAHEFNNVIGGIHGCVRLALDGEDDPGRRELLEVIERAAERGAAVTEQLLRFARQRVQAVGPVDVGQVLDESLKLIGPRAQQAGVRIERGGPRALSIRADGSALHQVFLNLATNAVQAMPGGGLLRVDLDEVGDEVRIRFRDSGVGIPAEQIEHVFEPFWTSRDREPDPARRGTGLGLSVSHGLVEAHGGSIEVESEPGRGSTFTVRIPGPEQRDDDEDGGGS
jgi:signal transduction histidine kinase